MLSSGGNKQNRLAKCLSGPVWFDAGDPSGSYLKLFDRSGLEKGPSDKRNSRKIQRFQKGHIHVHCPHDPQAVDVAEFY